MDYVEGTELFDMVDAGELTDEDKKKVTEELALAIHELHNRGVAHRDIKLENIFFNENTRSIKLIDYGFATWEGNKFINRGVGTRSTVDPKITLGDIESILDSDWWSYGQTIFDMYLGYNMCGKSCLKNPRKATSAELNVLPEPVRDIISSITDPTIRQEDRPTELEIMYAISQLYPPPRSSPSSPASSAARLPQSLAVRPVDVGDDDGELAEILARSMPGFKI